MFPPFVIPGPPQAEPGIQFLAVGVDLPRARLPLACGERVTFLTPGILPSAATRPATLFAPLLRRSACAKKVTKETHPRRRGLRASGNCSCVALPPASLPSPALRVRERRPGSADRPSMACSGIGAIPRADPADLIVHRSPHHRGPRWGGILPRKQRQQLAGTMRRGERSFRRSAGMHGFMDPAPFAVPSIAGGGDKARRGARTMRARRLQCMDVLSADPAAAEKRRAV